MKRGRLDAQWILKKASRVLSEIRCGLRVALQLAAGVPAADVRVCTHAVCEGQWRAMIDPTWAL